VVSEWSVACGGADDGRPGDRVIESSDDGPDDAAPWLLICACQPAVEPLVLPPLRCSLSWDDHRVEDVWGWIADAAWPWINDFGAALGALAAVVTGTVAVAALLVATRDSAERSRPMLIAELVSDRYASATQHLVLRNVGPSVARDVKVSFDPPLPEVPDPSGLVTPFIKQRYEGRIPVIAPGQRLSNIWFSGEAGPGGGWINREPLPDSFVVELEYKGNRLRRYRDRFPLTIDVIRRETYVTSSKDPMEQLKKAMKELPKIVTALQSIARASARAADGLDEQAGHDPNGA